MTDSHRAVPAPLQRFSPEQATDLAAHLMRQLRIWGEEVPDTHALDVVWPVYHAAVERRPAVRAAWAAYEASVTHQCVIDDEEAEEPDSPLSSLATWLLADIWELLDRPHTAEELHSAIDEIVTVREKVRTAAREQSEA